MAGPRRPGGTVTKKYSLEHLQLPDLEKVPEEVRKRAVREAVKVISKRTKEEAPDSGDPHTDLKRYKLGPKGKLNRSIGYSVRKHGREGAVRARAPHAHLVHDGTRGHWIKSKYGKRLAIVGRGKKKVYTWAVWHPGARANPFLERSLEQSMAEVERVLREAGEAGIREALR